MIREREVNEILRMIENEKLDIRTVTLGVSLRNCISDTAEGIAEKVYNKLLKVASNLPKTVDTISSILGVPIVNKRIAVTPISIIAEGYGEEGFIKVAESMERAAKEIGIDYIGGYSALVHKGATIGDTQLMVTIPTVLSTTERVCSSVNVASTRTGINMDAVFHVAKIIKEIAEATREQDAIGCAKFVVFANAVEDNPFIAGAFHGVGEPELTVNIGVSGPGVVLGAIKRLKESRAQINLTVLAETIKRMAFKITRAGELIGRLVARAMGEGYQFGVVDLSLAPTPAPGDSVAEILEELGVERTGAPGTTAALFLLTEAVKKGGLMASSSVGGLSGAFIPVSEDSRMALAVKDGALSLEKLEAMTAVCSVGLDMVPIPGDTPVETIAGIIADEMAIGVSNNKTTAVRIIPVPGKKAGETISYGGLLGEATILDVSKFSCREFINYGGRIPPPLMAFRN